MSKKYASEVSFQQHYRIEFDVPDGEDPEEWWETAAAEALQDWPSGQFVLDPDTLPGWQQVGGDFAEGFWCEPAGPTNKNRYSPEYVEPVGILVPRRCYQMVKDLVDAHAEAFPELWEDSK